MTTISAIYGLRKELGLDDDTARDFYARETGKRSLREMSVGEQVRIHQALAQQARTRPAAARKPLTGPYAGKLQALWISGWHLGAVRNRTDEALLTFVERRTGVSHIRFLRDAGDARKAVEALKSWLERDAGVDWSEHEDPADAVLAAQGRLLGFDQLDLDGTAGALAEGWMAWRRDELRPLERRDLMQRLGGEIRKRVKNGSRDA